MKRLISIILTLALLLGCTGFAFAGSGTSDMDGTSADGLRTFTDSTGRTVELPAQIERIAVSGPLAQIALFALAPDKLVGIASEWDKTAAEYLATEYYQLPVLGQLYGGKGELNLEELLAAEPQVVIDVGEAKGSISEDMDALTAQTGIPFVHIDAALSTFGNAYAMLGELLAMPDEAAALANYCDSVYEKVSGIAANVDKVRLLYVTGAEGLNVIAQGSYHSEVIDMLGDNLAVVDSPSSKGTGNEVDMEQLLNWNPDYVLFAPGSIYANVGADATWQNITAIKDGHYYEVPFGPYNWMGFPPSVQRLAGMLWLAELLYPDAADYDLYDEIAEYYNLFYHCELTQAQYDALVANSIGK